MHLTAFETQTHYFKICYNESDRITSNLSKEVFYMDVLHIIENIIFGSSNTWVVISTILYIIGLWRIFQKSDVPGWKALIPWYREYWLGKCAGKEQEGRFLAVAQFIYTAGNIAVELIKNENARLFVAVISIMAWIIYAIYSIQVYNGLIDVYNVRKRWLWLWILAEPIPALVWGFNDKYQPTWKAGEFRDNAVSHVQGGEVADMGEGLTVNLNKREVNENPPGIFIRSFFGKKRIIGGKMIITQMGKYVITIGIVLLRNCPGRIRFERMRIGRHLLWQRFFC